MYETEQSYRCKLRSLMEDVCFWRDSPQWTMASSFTRFLDHTNDASQQTNIHAPDGIRTHNLSRRAAADLRLRPRGHCLMEED